jgi:group I intron endonuclease
MHEQTQIWSLYRITNKINGKVYIGQASDLSKRWSDHRRAVRLNKPTQIIHHAMIKYGIDNFEFMEIASCKGQDNTNEIETELVKQYSSFIKNEKGYNATYGGMNAPKSEAWFKAMENWRNSLSSEGRAEINKKHSDAMQLYIATKGPPAQGYKWTDEQRVKMSKTQLALDKEAIYSEKVREKMSESHIGIRDSEETKQKKSESASKAWAKRVDYTDIKCSAPDCDIVGKAKYKIIDGVRYCNKHGLRLLRYNRLDCLSD